MVIDEKDNVFCVNTSTANLSFVEKSGLEKNKFGLYHASGDKYVYIIGGKDNGSDDNLTKCQKFNVTTCEWESMPNLNKARFGPGVFISHD